MLGRNRCHILLCGERAPFRDAAFLNSDIRRHLRADCNPGCPDHLVEPEIWIRSFLFFACSGAAIGVLAQGFLFQSISLVSWLFVVAGLDAGLIYWLVVEWRVGGEPG
jgi:hypothetical protein